MKIWIFASLLLSLGLIASFVLAPTNRGGAAMAAAARMEFENYQIYDIGVEGVSGVLTAQSGRVFDDREELDYPVALRRINGANDGLSSVLGVVRGDILMLESAVYYWNDSGETLKTELAEYNRTSGIVTGSGGFTLIAPNGVMDGVDFIADSVNKTFSANDVKATLDDNKSM
ncbi:MAG: hypothetical protein LBI57_07980 [Helicobacteraceae bacterium]|nr:hypothetical protein [Helicobacteraceae bacterium]